MGKEWIRKLLHRFDLELYRRSTLSRGMSLEVDLARLFANGPTVLFDVGANVGQTSLRLASVFPQAEIYAFEPVSRTYQELVTNTRLNTKIHNNHLSLGERDGAASMILLQESTWSRVVTEPIAGATIEEVKMARLDTYCRERKLSSIDLLKTDCEGYDLQVLQGAHDMLANSAITAIYSEVNFNRDGRQMDFFAMESYLSGFGYVFYGLYDYSGWQYPIPTDGFTNALFVHKSVWAC